MPALVIAGLALQVLCVVHALRTGRDRMWVYVVILLPVAGSIAYAVCELLPELIGPRRAQDAAAAARRLLDPERDYREALKRFEISPTSYNRRRLAEACVARGHHDAAAEHYRAMLTGHDADDPELLRSLARIQFLQGDCAGALATLDELKRRNPGYRSGEAHLLYARSLEELGRHREALDEYRALADYWSGEEPRGRMAQLLDRLDRKAEAAAVRAQILRAERLAPKHYVRANRAWIEAAKRAETTR